MSNVTNNRNDRPVKTSWTTRLLREIREVARVTLATALPAIGFVAIKWRARALKRAAVREQIVLGERIHELRLGNNELRGQIDKRLDVATSRSVVDELKLRLAEPHLIANKPLPGTEAEHVAAWNAREAFTAQKTISEAARRALWPNECSDRIRLGVGLTLATVMLAGLVWHVLPTGQRQPGPYAGYPTVVPGQFRIPQTLGLPDQESATQKQVEEFVQKGKDYNEQLDFRKAQYEFDRAIQLDPKCTEAYIQRTVAHSSLGNHDAAMRDAVEAVRLDRDSAAAYASRASVYFSLSELDKALEDAGQSLRIDRKLVGAILIQSAVFNAQGRHQDSLREANNAIKVNPEHAGAFVCRGSAYASMDDNKRAEADLKKAISLNPKCMLAYIKLGSIYFLAREYEKALAEFDQAVRVDPQNGAALFTRGQAYRELNKNDLAVEDLTKAIKINPKHTDAYLFRGLIKMGEKQFAAATSDFAKAIQLDPTGKQTATLPVHLWRGQAYLAQKGYDLALADFNVAIREGPKECLASAHSGRCQVYRAQKKFELAINDADEAIKCDPTRRDLYRERAQSYFAKNDFDATVRDLVKVTELDPESPAARYELGRILEVAGRKDEAKASLEFALRLNPDMAAAKEALELLENPELARRKAESADETFSSLAAARRGFLSGLGDINVRSRSHLASHESVTDAVEEGMRRYRDQLGPTLGPMGFYWTNR